MREGAIDRERLAAVVPHLRAAAEPVVDEAADAGDEDASGSATDPGRSGG